MKHLMLVGLALAILVGGGLASETKVRILFTTVRIYMYLSLNDVRSSIRLLDK
jgi:hypothetical protein